VDPVRTLLDPILPALEPAAQESVRATLDLFPLAYRDGALAALKDVSERLQADERAGVTLDVQRFWAALNGALAATDRLPVPDVWAGR
jgi:hypothetical protein